MNLNHDDSISRHTSTILYLPRNDTLSSLTHTAHWTSGVIGSTVNSLTFVTITAARHWPLFFLTTQETTHSPLRCIYSTFGPNKTIILLTAERQNTASQRLPKTITTSQFRKTAVKSQDGIHTGPHTHGQRHKRHNQVSYVPRKESPVEMWWHTVTHGMGSEGGNWRMEWVASTLHTTSEHGASSITTADEHTSAASSRLNWRHHRLKWTRPFRRKTKFGFCACTITFQTQSTSAKSRNCASFAWFQTRARRRWELRSSELLRSE